VGLLIDVYAYVNGCILRVGFFVVVCLGMAKWAGPDGSARQPDKKNMGRVKKFNPPTPYSPARQARWPVGPTRGPKRASPRPVPVN